MQHALALFVVFLPAISVADEPKARTPKVEFEALSKEYEAAREAWRKLVPEPMPEPGDQFWIEHYQSSLDWSYAPRFIAFAEMNSTDKTAAEACLIVLKMNPSTRDRAVFRFYLQARDLLIHEHLEEEMVVRAFLSNPTFLSGNMEPYFHALLAKSKDHDTLGRACMALVRCNQLRMRIAARPFWEHPEDHLDRLKRSLFLNERLDPDYIDYFKSADVDALSLENEALLERVVEKFGDVSLRPRWSRADVQAKDAGRTLAESAKASLYQIRSLVPGKVAPEIEGQDIEGATMRLSDYRGKVVVLVFWGTWCGPCLRSIPMEKALAERLKDQPFAILGINSDADREKVKASVVKEGITWRSWFDGGKTGGPIADRWNVHGWPTIVVIDQEGVIRFHGLPHHTPKPLDDAVNSLLAEPKP